MKMHLLIIFITAIVSCSKTNRGFFKNLHEKNSFLDTFTLSRLKGFGLSDKEFVKDGKIYYGFNIVENSIYLKGFFRLDNNKIFFLPKDSENELLFFDSTFLRSNDFAKQNTVITKSRSVYEVEFLGMGYNSKLKANTNRIELSGNNITNITEKLIFELNSRLDIVSIEHVNCRNDTLTMVFMPKRQVYYTNINKDALCL